MLKVTIRKEEYFDEAKSQFIDTGESFTLELEHSLVSLSKWESKFEKPFLSEKAKTDEETLEYIRFMILNEHELPANYMERITPSYYPEINSYIAAKMSATWFNESAQPSSSRETITSEVIYYWLVALQIPFECQYWHLNRLLALVKVCNLKNQPDKKMSRTDAAARQRALNQARRQQYQSRG